MHLRPKPDHRLSAWSSFAAALVPTREEEEEKEAGGESAGVALHEGVTETQTHTHLIVHKEIKKFKKSSNKR